MMPGVPVGGLETAVRGGDVGGPVLEAVLELDGLDGVRAEVREPVAVEAHAVRVLAGELRRPLLALVDLPGPAVVRGEPSTGESLDEPGRRGAGHAHPVVGQALGQPQLRPDLLEDAL